MPGPWAVQNLQIPHPQNGQGGQMPRSSPGGGGGGGGGAALGTGGIDWCIKAEIINCIECEAEHLMYMFQKLHNSNFC